MVTPSDSAARAIVVLLSDASRPADRRVKSGSLRMFGDWFGRPMDNLHWVVGAEAAGDTLTVRFNEGEKLMVWRPRGVSIDRERFVIQSADRVRWEWFYYGRPKLEVNRQFVEYWIDGGDAMHADRTGNPADPLSPSRGAPAVEIL